MDNNFCYTLSHESTTQISGLPQSSGLRLFDLENLSETSTVNSYSLAGAQVGAYSAFDYSKTNGRLTYQNSLKHINIVPVLHRNIISFMGMQDRDKYLATKVILDKFLAFDKYNYITCWSILTGKLLCKHKIDVDFTEYEIYVDEGLTEVYRRDFYPFVLL